MDIPRIPTTPASFSNAAHKLFKLFIHEDTLKWYFCQSFVHLFSITWHGSTHSFNPFSVFLSGADSFGQFVRSCWLLGGRFPLLRLTTLATMGGSIHRGACDMCANQPITGLNAFKDDALIHLGPRVAPTLPFMSVNVEKPGPARVRTRGQRRCARCRSAYLKGNVCATCAWDDIAR